MRYGSRFRVAIVKQTLRRQNLVVHVGCLTQVLIPNSIWDGEFPESGTPIHEPILLAEAAVDRHWIAASAEFNDPVAPPFLAS